MGPKWILVFFMDSFFYMCVWYVYVHACVFVWVGVPMCVPMEARGRYWMSSSITLHLFETGSLTKSKFCDWLNLLTARPWDPLISTPQHWDSKHAPPFPAFYVVLIRWYLLWLMVSKVRLCSFRHTTWARSAWWSKAAHLLALETQHERGRSWGST